MDHSATSFSSTSTAATSAASFPAGQLAGAAGGAHSLGVRGSSSYAARVRPGASTWARLFGGGAEGDEEEDFGCRGGGGGVLGVGSHFLDACFLCRRALAGNRDIFMYRGDTPFCSEDCRREQIEMDEEKERRKEMKKAITMRAATLRREVEAPPKTQKVRAGPILAG